MIIYGCHRPGLLSIVVGEGGHRRTMSIGRALWLQGSHA